MIHGTSKDACGVPAWVLLANSEGWLHCKISAVSDSGIPMGLQHRQVQNDHVIVSHSCANHHYQDKVIIGRS